MKKLNKTKDNIENIKSLITNKIIRPEFERFVIYVNMNKIKFIF